MKARKPDLMELQAVAGQVSGLLRKLANQDRLLILCQLVDGEQNVGELGLKTGIAQPTLSQQLTVLREESLVATERRGKFVFYHLDNPDVLVLMKTLYDLYCSPSGKEAS